MTYDVSIQPLGACSAQLWLKSSGRVAVANQPVASMPPLAKRGQDNLWLDQPCCSCRCVIVRPLESLVLVQGDS
jgi:hypothetical protein